MVKQEPTANARHMATSIYDMFLALTQEGFTRKEALQIVGIAISAAMMSGGQQDG